MSESVANQQHLQVELRLQHCSLTQERQDYLKQDLGLIPRLVEKFPNPHMHVDIEKVPNGDFQLKMSLMLSGETLVSGDSHADLRAAWHHGIHKLVKAIRDHKAQLSHRSQWGREA